MATTYTDTYTPDEIQAAEMLVRFYNAQAGTAFRAKNISNQNNVIGALRRAGNIAAVKNHIREYVANNADAAKTTDGFNACLDTCGISTGVIIDVPAEPTPATPSVGGLDAAMALMAQTMTGLLAQTKVPEIEASIMGSVEDKVRDFIRSEYGHIERKVTTVVDGVATPQDEIVHDKFESVVKFVSNDIPVLLTGPAGSGKNVLCKQIAKALGLKFYFTNAVTQEYKLTGFTDAMGNYQPTQFYKAFTEGGLFMLDEIDASIPEVLVILNAAIANRYFDFPAPIGYVEAHPDFRVIAAGNTFGTGASYEYVGRNQLDAASLNRFAVVRVGYSEAIENSVAGDEDLADFCRAFRTAALKAGQQIVVSYRNIDMLAKMSQIMKLDEALETCLVKGMEKDDLNVIINDLPAGKFRIALRKVADRL